MLLQVRNLTKSYFMKKNAVNDLSIDIEIGGIYELLGPNGHGKTTFMKMIAGLVKPTKGKILFEGGHIGPKSKNHVVYSSTEPFFYDYMTVKDIGNYYRDVYRDFDHKLFYSLLDEMELDVHQKATALSSGLAAKLKIAAAFARKATLYMLDEPLNGIDIIAREKVVDIIKRMARKDCTIIVSSHLVEDLEHIVDHAIFIKQGQIAAVGTADALRAKYGKPLSEAYKDIYAQA